MLEELRAEARAADQAHTQAVAAARQAEAQLWQERLQQAEAAAHQQVSEASAAVAACNWSIGLPVHPGGGCARQAYAVLHALEVRLIPP